MSAWLAALQSAVSSSSQAAVARRLRQSDGFPSHAVISQVLSGKYQGRTERLQAVVEGVLLSKTVPCPVLGEIGRDQCDDWQTKPFATSNATRLQVFRACRSGCPHSRLQEGGR